MNHRLKKKKGKVLSEECWSLDITLAKYILPRLEYFKEHTNSHPSYITYEEWMEILDTMINSFRMVLKEDYFFLSEKSEIQEGLNLFAMYYMHLWI